MRRRWGIPDEIRLGLLAGLLSGLAGALLFATAHAILIVPIWSRMWWGLVSGAIAGAAAGWTLMEIHPVLPSSRARTVATGARFGAILWLLVAPVTAADVLLRVAGIAPRFELVAVGVAIALALGGGATYGWYRTRRGRGAMASAAATLTLTIAMAGPVPVGRSPRAFGIFLAVLPAAILAGSVLAFLIRSFQQVPGQGTGDEAGSGGQSFITP